MSKNSGGGQVAAKAPDPIPVEDPNTAKAEVALRQRQQAASSVANDLEGGSAEDEKELRKATHLAGRQPEQPLNDTMRSAILAG